MELEAPEIAGRLANEPLLLLKVVVDNNPLEVSAHAVQMGLLSEPSDDSSLVLKVITDNLHRLSPDKVYDLLHVSFNDEAPNETANYGLVLDARRAVLFDAGIRRPESWAGYFEESARSVTTAWKDFNGIKADANCPGCAKKKKPCDFLSCYVLEITMGIVALTLGIILWKKWS